MPELGSRLHAVDLADGSVRSWSAPPLFVFHAAQAFEQGPDLVVDLCLTDKPLDEQFDMQRLRSGSGAAESAAAIRARHTGFVLSPGAASAREEALPGRFELPQVNAAIASKGPARYVWGATAEGDSGFFNRTVTVDHKSGTVTEAGLAGPRARATGDAQSNRLERSPCPERTRGHASGAKYERPNDAAAAADLLPARARRAPPR